MTLARLENKNVEFIVEMDENIPSILVGDDIKVRQIIINLLSNAVKFTNEGYIYLSVKAGEFKENKVRLDCSVKDTGKGIKEKDIERIFSVFTQSDLHRNYGNEGTGLGLSICKQFVSMMDGEIHCESVYNQGADFVFSIWQRCSALDAIDADEMFAIPFVAPDAKVLIVDDNTINLKVAEGIMKPMKMSIDLAHGGVEAVSMVRSNDYDLVFMDHMMPDMDGIEATQSIRALGGSYSDLPIIALTANAIKGMRENFLASGMNDYLSKPIITEQMNIVLRKWLPKEKLIFVEEDKLVDEIAVAKEENREELPAISGIDAKSAMDALGSYEFYMSLLADCYRTMGIKGKEMLDFLECEDIRRFTIEVHAMKNVMRTIGAFELGEAFFRMEQMGNANEVDVIKSEFSSIMEEYDRIYTELAAYVPEEDKVAVDVEEWISSLQKLSLAMDEFDLDSVDEIMTQLRGYVIPTELEEDFKQLQAFVSDVDMDQVISLVEEMVKKLN